MIIGNKDATHMQVEQLTPRHLENLPLCLNIREFQG